MTPPRFTAVSRTTRTGNCGIPPNKKLREKFLPSRSADSLVYGIARARDRSRCAWATRWTATRHKPRWATNPSMPCARYMAMGNNNRPLHAVRKVHVMIKESEIISKCTHKHHMSYHDLTCSMQALCTCTCSCVGWPELYPAMTTTHEPLRVAPAGNRDQLAMNRLG